MADLAGRDLLDLWERADGLSPQRRALVLAEAVAGAPLGARSVGQRDAWLLALHEQLVGPTLEAVASCPGCAEEIEFALDAPTLRKSADHVEARGTTRTGGRLVSWRVPTADDLVDLERFDDPESAAAELLVRCLGDDAALTDDQRAQVSTEIADADPLAEVVAGLGCPACGRSFTAEVDVAEFAWRALHDAGRRLLGEVDVLARAYGWTEPEVLALAARRRAAYLELVGERS